jgi:hypothetical protein
VAQIDVSLNESTFYVDAFKWQLITQWRFCQHIYQKARGETAAIIPPSILALFVGRQGIDLGRSASLVEIRSLALFKLRPSPAFRGFGVIVTRPRESYCPSGRNCALHRNQHTDAKDE